MPDTELIPLDDRNLAPSNRGAMTGPNALFAPGQMSFDDILRAADFFAKSKLFGGIQNVETAVSLMLVCQAEGRHPVDAMKRYHIIQGRVAMRADAMLAEFQLAGGRVEWTERTDTRVSAVFTHPAGGSVPVTWDIEQARRAGLAGKDNWKNYPRQMLTARVISEGIRTVLPGVVAGVYTPEENQDFAPEPTRPTNPALRTLPPEAQAHSEQYARNNYDPSEDDEPFGSDDEERPAAPPAVASEPAPNTCAECGAPMTKPQVIMSKNKFGRPLCLTHQREATPKSASEGGL